MALPVDLGPNYWGTNYNYNEGMLNTPDNPDIINYQSYLPGNRYVSNPNYYSDATVGDDLTDYKYYGVPLDNSDNRYNTLNRVQSGGYGFDPNFTGGKNDIQFKYKTPRTIADQNRVLGRTFTEDQGGFGITQIENPYRTYMHPYDNIDRWTADEDMQYQPDVQSNRFSGLTNPVKTGAGMLMSGLMKIPGAGIFLDAVQPASPGLKAQAGAVSAADRSGLMAGKNMISMFGTNDPEQMILDRIERIKNRKAAQTDFSRNRIIELQRLADEANRAKHTASADLGGGWTRQNRPGGRATFTGPGGQTHQGWSNTAAGTRAAAASEGSFARGGIIGAF